MADNNGQDRNNRQDNEDFKDDPALTARVRRDLETALTPEAGEPPFGSRRAQIMAQLRAESNQPTTVAASTPPIKLADRRPTEPTAQPSAIRRPVERPNRRLSFGSFGALAAGLVILLIAGIALLALNLTSNNSSTSSGAIAVSNSTAPNSNQDRAATSATTAATGATIAASATTVAMTSAAATTSQAPAAAAPAPTAGTSTGSGASNASTTIAAATTAAMTTAAATTAAATTAASATTAAAATTAATATTAAASSNPGARAILLPLYRGASEIILPGNATGVKAFLTDQTNRFGPDQTKRLPAGLQDSDISRYSVTGTKAPGAKADDVATFYNDEARKSGYTLEANLRLQDDNSLKVRWLYLSRGSQHLAVLIVETLQANNNPLQREANLSAGETGIFFLTSP